MNEQDIYAILKDKCIDESVARQAAREIAAAFQKNFTSAINACCLAPADTKCPSKFGGFCIGTDHCGYRA